MEPAALVPVPAAHGEETDALCANCGATLTGHYCSSCGQKGEHPVQSLWHFIFEATEDLTHADSRVWRTIGALLFKPGFLTTEFLAGRRVRYLPPIRLYLVTSVLLFLLAAIGNSHNPEQTPVEVAKTNAEIAKAKAEYHRATGRELLIIAQDVKPSADRQEQLANCAKVENEARKSVALKAAALSLAHKACMSAVKDNGHALGEAFLHNLPRALFITLPVMAALMKLLYWRPRRYYVEHLLFLLHNYAFIYVWFSILILLGWIITPESIMGPVTMVAALYLPYYYFRGMQHFYAERVGRTAAKFTVLSLAYLVVGALAFVATGVYSVLAQ